MPSRSRKSPGVRLNDKLRIGIHLGDVSVDKSDTVYPPDSEKAVDDLLTEDYWSNYYPFRDMQEVAVEEPDSLPDLVSFPSIVDDGYIDNEGTTFYRWGGSPPTRHAFRGGVI